VKCGWYASPFDINLTVAGLVMNQSEFEADLRREGYQVFYGGLQAGTVNPDHSHVDAIVNFDPKYIQNGLSGA
jgi:hypothetical protein